MKTIQITNLPSPDDLVLSYIKDYVTDGEFENFYRNKVSNEVYGGNINMVLSNQIGLHPLFELIQKQYQPYFVAPIIRSYFDFLTNVEPDKGPATLPPHIHTIRTLALNYFIDLGGENVKTCFYTHKPKTGMQVFEPQEKWGGYLSLEDVSPYGHIVTEKSKWHVYNTRIPHSVEGVTGTRIFLSLVFDATHEMADLLLEEKLEYNVIPIIKD